MMMSSAARSLAPAGPPPRVVMIPSVGGGIGHISRTAALARALHKHTDIGDEIPARLYAAVAEVLAYVYQLRAYRPGGRYPDRPTKLEVPADMDPNNPASKKPPQ